MEVAFGKSGDIYEQAFVKPVLSLSKGWLRAFSRDFQISGASRPLVDIRRHPIQVLRNIENNSK